MQKVMIGPIKKREVFSFFFVFSNVYTELINLSFSYVILAYSLMKKKTKTKKAIRFTFFSLVLIILYQV